MRILDLFCGGGVGAVGYRLSFPDAVIVGVDIRDMSSSYPFTFMCFNALRLDYNYLDSFDFIHASPPCQAYSKATPRDRRASHQRLIAGTLALVHAAGKPYVVENVEGSGQELQPNICIELDGKRRYFNTSFKTPIKAKISSCYSSSLFGKAYVSKAEIGRSWGIPNDYLERMTRKNIRQGVPPIMIQQLMKYYQESVK